MAKKLTIAALFLAGAGLASSVAAQTALTSTRTATAAQFTTSQSQSRNGVGTSTFIGPVSSTGPTLVPISRFDTNTGILVGARMSVNLPITLGLSALGTVPATGNNRRVNVTSTVSGSVALAGATVTSTTFTVSERCDNSDCLALSAINTTNSTRTLAGTSTVAAANLASLAGAGPGTVNFTTTVTAANTQIVNRSNVTTGFANSRFTVGGTTTSANQYSVAYDYLNFANPSFNNASTVRTTAVNFGTRFIDSGTASQSITLTNIGNVNSAGVAVNSVTRATNDSNLTTTLTSIANLAGGNSQAFAVGLNPTTVGTHTDTFTLNASDYAPGGVGIRPYALTVNASSTLINHANPSFNGSTVETTKSLDFGLVSVRGGPALRNFSLFNIGDINSAGLELVSVSSLNGASPFSTNASPFLNLTGGGSNPYAVTFNPLTLGAASNVYTFLFRDYAPGVTGGRNFTLTLNILGMVFDPVPEPGTWMTMLLGFGLVGAVARRRAAAAV